jgi:hypothetical protein
MGNDFCPYCGVALGQLGPAFECGLCRPEVRVNDDTISPDVTPSDNVLPFPATASPVPPAAKPSLHDAASAAERWVIGLPWYYRVVAYLLITAAGWAARHFGIVTGN